LSRHFQIEQVSKLYCACFTCSIWKHNRKFFLLHDLSCFFTLCVYVINYCRFLCAHTVSAVATGRIGSTFTTFYRYVLHFAFVLFSLPCIIIAVTCIIIVVLYFVLLQYCLRSLFFFVQYCSSQLFLLHILIRNLLCTYWCIRNSSLSYKNSQLVLLLFFWYSIFLVLCYNSSCPVRLPATSTSISFSSASTKLHLCLCMSY
jgi:hypothetical protein